MASMLAVAVVAIACSDGPTGPDPSAAVGVLDWSSCGANECARLDVPLDHADPGGSTISLAVERHRASGERIGVLVVNPGGPGGDGTSLVDRIVTGAPELADRFDVVGWDPRGVGDSAPLRCDDGLRELYRLDATPDDDAELEALHAAAADAADACDAAHGDLLPHLGTVATVDDLELLRQALGEDEISFLGFSYGTAIGLVYAERHGDHLRALVLDGIFDPTVDLETWLTAQSVALEAALDRILGDDAPAYLDAQARVEAGDLGAGPQDLAHAALAATYDPRREPAFVRGVREAAAGQPATVVGLVDGYLSGPAFDAYTAIVCADRVSPQGTAAFTAMAEKLATIAPRLGGTVANELSPCAHWPVVATPPTTTLTTDVAMLILGNRGDAATPYVDALRVSDSLDGAVLVSLDGRGHLSFLQGSPCVDTVVTDYLTTATLPPSTTCPSV